MRSLSDADIRDFWSAHYRPANLVVAVAGDIAHEDVVELVDVAFGRGASIAQTIPPAPRSPVERLRVQQRDTSQAYICLGVTGLPRDHADQWTLELLNTVLGDGTSSRLFMSIREEAGLAYDVHSFQTDYADCGTLQVYLGVDADDLRAAADGCSRSSPGCATSGSRRPSSSGLATTPSGASSCAWRNRGPWRRSWAPRRRCTTGC